MMREGLTYNDVLLVPRYSDIATRKSLSTQTRLSRRITLNTPIVSANMDTVTEAKMATKMAELGGIGIIHRFLTIEQQVAQVARVKRSHNFFISDPYTMRENATLADVRAEIVNRGVNSFLVINEAGRLAGMLTPRDLLFEENSQTLVSELMTPFERLIVKTVEPGARIDYEEARELLRKHRLEKLPLVYSDRNIAGLITSKDIHKRMEYPLAVKDASGRLLVGAAVGVKNDYLERAGELVKAGVDVLVIDIAHGHSKFLIETLSDLKSNYPQVDIIAGNVATGPATRDLILAGADSIKVGVGPGSTCSTRIVTGSGVPQLTAVLDARAEALNHNVPIIADGGVRTSGDIVKALAAGAATVMLGGMIAGCEESPGLIRLKDGQKVKILRGMASFDAAMNRQSSEAGYSVDLDSYVPEGIETVSPYKGQVADIIAQLLGGVRSGMSYLGARTIEEMEEKADFIRMSGAGWNESTPHAKS